MLSGLIQTVQLFTLLIPAALYCTLLPLVFLGELLHQVYPDLYPTNFILEYVDQRI